MKVLITGATGFLGSHVAEMLVQDNHEVRAIVRKTSNVKLLEELGVELCQASLERGDGLAEAVDGVDAVVHGAGIVKAKRPEEFYAVNAAGTQNLVDAALASNKAGKSAIKSFVYVSSLTAHGFNDAGGPRPLDAESNPVTHYGRSKLEGERYVLSKKDELAVTVIRPPAIYGPRDTEMIAFFKLVKGRIVPFLGDSRRKVSLIYATDCARAIVLSLVEDHPSGRVYSVEDGRAYSQDEFVSIVEDAIGKPAFLKFPIPIGIVRAAAVGSELYGKLTGKAMMLTRDKVNELDAEQLSASADTIREELGWNAEVQFEEGARRSVAWYRAEGLL